MEILTKEGFDQRMNLIQRIIMDCRTSVHNWERIEKPKSNERLFAEHPFTQHLCGHYWFMLITQLAKLYAVKGNHKTTFRKLLNKLKDEGDKKDDVCGFISHTNERRERPYG